MEYLIAGIITLFIGLVVSSWGAKWFKKPVWERPPIFASVVMEFLLQVVIFWGSIALAIFFFWHFNMYLGIGGLLAALVVLIGFRGRS